MADTTHLVLPLMAAAQSQKHVTHNDALLMLDALVQLSVIDRSLTAPPGAPTEGDRYIVASGGTGAWATKDLNVATWIDGAWLFLVPREGWVSWVEDENLLFVWNGSNWIDLATAGGFVLASELATDLETGEYDLLGINGATADTTNRLAVNTPAVLFNRGTDDIIVKLNKQAAADDAAFSLQTNFSTRLLFGTLGSDDTALRVSPDGSTFYDALIVDKDDGTATMLRLGLGGATADAANRLSVTSPAILFNRGTDDIDVKLNKQAAADDARFTFQTNFSTRALIGTIGNDDFSISVSPDGSTFFSAMAIDKDTGNVAIGTSSDGTNRLLVSGTNNLFTSSGNLSFTFNKGASGDDNSLTFQTGFSARALVGLLGNDDFTFKVTPDGSTYKTAMVIDKDTGGVSFSEHPKFSAYVNFDRYVAANTWTLIDNNNARHNDQGDWGSGLFTAPHDGYFLFGAGYRFKANSTVPTDIRVGLSVDAATPLADRIATTGDATIVTLQSSVHITGLIKLTAGQTVSARAFMTGFDGYVEADSNYFWGCQVA